MKGSVRRAAIAAGLLVISAVSFYAGRQSSPALNVKLDNQRVTVTESVTPGGGRREPYTRQTDQLIIFLDEARYESIDAAGRITPRHRQPGDVIWHSRGEAAPLLVNKGKAYRNLIIALKP